jgi:hypothetical protein
LRARKFRAKKATMGKWRGSGGRSWRGPPLEEWERQEALRVVAQVAVALDGADFDRDVAPIFRRLTPKQRGLVQRALQLLERILEDPPSET